MNIKAAEMERIFGMSQNGIRLYEKHGILRPAHTWVKPCDSGWIATPRTSPPRC